MDVGTESKQAPLLFQWGIFPVVMGSAVVASWWLIAGGIIIYANEDIVMPNGYVQMVPKYAQQTLGLELRYDF
jgi:hypothetical protein